MLLFNIFSLIIIFISFSLSIVGYGYHFKKYLTNENNFEIGESGIFGFVFLYLVAVTIHFFFSLNQVATITILIIGIFLSIKIHTKIKEYFNKNLFIYLLIISLSLILAATNNLHDDVYLYQLPYIKYLQSEKIIFGLSSLNDFAAYSHGLYDIMSLFKVPIFKNQTIFLIPVIFVMFFLFILNDNLKVNKNYLKVFTYIILFLFLFKFTRSKQFGTDVPVICLLFLIQIYILNYIKSENKNYFFKSVIIFIFAVFLKIYAIFSIFYFLFFLIKFKENILIFFKNRNLVFFICFICLITFSKNIIHTGCLMYPVTSTCLEKENANWSIGKKAIELRKVSLEAATKGIRIYIRNQGHLEIITPKEYLDKFKYTYHLNVIKDPDFERFLVLVSIFLILWLTSTVNFFIKKKDYLIEEKFDKKILYLSFFPFLAWIIYIPHIRYGGYSYVAFFLYLLFLELNLFKYLTKKNLNILLILGLVFIFSKNYLRIKDEYYLKKFSINNYPLPEYKTFNFSSKKINNLELNISNHWQLCGEIPFPCLVKTNFDSINQIKSVFGYYFINSDEQKVIKHMKKEIYKIHYEMN
mgnify:CR=1 FL=1